jgi:hypothetical protein
MYRTIEQEVRDAMALYGRSHGNRGTWELKRAYERVRRALRAYDAMGDDEYAGLVQLFSELAFVETLGERTYSAADEARWNGYLNA